MMDSAKRVINGTWGEVWVDGYKIAECYKAQAKISKTTEEINLCGKMMTDVKTTACKGTGSLGLYKVYSRFKDYAESVLSGTDTRATIITKLADPDAYGVERIAYYNCSFDDHTLTDFEAKTPGKIEMPFTFTGFCFLDEIEA